MFYSSGSGPVKCPNEMSSETEHYSGCSCKFLEYDYFMFSDVCIKKSILKVCCNSS